ncbi:uncharacterized protein LOC135701760 [Ochlerotatus camptorhynchus]|uniref:uncharacterized protein LOC135701760 n=1 Tax=Ochlerotatus camptorhynchus TaxID=644619 RepID=UPI0031CF70A1
MCRCCQSCWEDFYWNCIEEKFCYDETIANYDPEDDEYATEKKPQNGFYNSEESMENNNAPICRQPASIGHNSIVSSKIHEDDLRREIQTNVPMLAPEVMAVFANSQIFQEHSPPKSITKSPASVKFAISPDSPPIETSSVPSLESSASTLKREDDSDKLLKRLEGSRQDLQSSKFGSKVIPSIVEEAQDDEVVLRPPRSLIEASASFSGSTSLINKNISHLQAEQPYFSTRPASENDIFTIASSSNYNAISMTPEVPAISYSNLPKSYLETPTVEKYRESVSLYSIQTAGMLSANVDLSMPRYYGKSDLIMHSANETESTRNLNLSDISMAGSSTPVSSNSIRHIEKSKRLKNIRTALPPLNLQLIRGSSSPNNKEKEKEKDKLKAKDSIKL